jgi:hypothetical protein
MLSDDGVGLGVVVVVCVCVGGGGGGGPPPTLKGAPCSFLEKVTGYT